MTVDEALDAAQASRKALAAHFGRDWIGEICDYRGHPWRTLGHRTVGWWDDGTTDHIEHPTEPTYVADIRDSWSAGGYTLYSIRDNGISEEWLFEDDHRIDGVSRNPPTP